jgi:hypothetical protein
LDGDTTISADIDDQIDFKVAGTDVVKITAATLDVTGPGNTGGIININNTDTEGANTDNIGRINFVGNDGSSSASGTRAAIETEVTGNFGSTQLNIEVAAGGAAAAKIATFSPTGLNLADGDITLASGHGINFAATADATGQASELLDDYEEGTWSIIVEDHNDNAMTLNGSYNTGTYVKVGGQVTITGYFLVTSLGSASGAVRIDGLPYTILGNARNYTGMLVGYAAGLNVTAGTTIAGVSIINTNHVNLTNFDTAAGTTNLDASKVTADGQMIFSMTYMTI